MARKFRRRPRLRLDWLSGNDFYRDAYDECDITSISSYLENEQPVKFSPLCAVKDDWDMIKHMAAEHRELFDITRQRRSIREGVPYASTSFSLTASEDYQSPESPLRLSESLLTSNANSFNLSSVKKFPKFDFASIDDMLGKSTIKERNSCVKSSLTFEERDQRAKFVQQMVFSATFNE